MSPTICKHHAIEKTAKTPQNQQDVFPNMLLFGNSERWNVAFGTHVIQSTACAGGCCPKPEKRNFLAQDFVLGTDGLRIWPTFENQLDLFPHLRLEHSQPWLVT